MTNTRKKETKNTADPFREEMVVDLQPENTLEDLENFVKTISVEVQDITDEGMTMEFDLVGAMASVANAIRRALLVEVPSMAPETILLQQNKSVMADEVLGHRLGLIPFKADARKYKFRPPGSKNDHPDYAVLFDLIVEAPKQNLKTDRKYISTKVYSSQFKWIRHPDAHPPAMDDSAIRPVSDKILVNILRPSQEMHLRIHVVKGIGKDHIKFSPVSLASYRQLPWIRLKKPVENEDADRLKGMFSAGVVEMDEEENGSRQARIGNARLDSRSQNVFRDPYLKNVVEMGLTKEHFIFSVESIGALNVAALVKEASAILRDRCEYHFLSIGTRNARDAHP